MKKITILGSTGSIGTQTLDVVRKNIESFCVVALTAGNNYKLMAEQIKEFRPRLVVMKDEKTKDLLLSIIDVKEYDCEVVYGMQGFVEAATRDDVDIVVAAMVGMIGLRPVMEAIKAKKDIALANKETLVTAGHIIMKLAKENNVKILPVDSEHSAIFQCLNGETKSSIETIYLTASGGPFRKYTSEQLKSVTVEDALKHPNWAMGKKITIDSATMINKGLEMIEAKWLFDVELDKVHVLIQPKSIIHSMVGFSDGAVIAQLGTPDMRLPIQYALFYPDRKFLDGERLDFETLRQIQFEKPNTEALRGLPIAKAASEIGGSMTTVMNAANEYAVAHFLKNDIKFLQIYDMIEYAMNKHKVINNPNLDEILQVEKDTYALLEKDYQIK